MPHSDLEKELIDQHRPEVIRTRLADQHKHNYLGDAVLGGIDGCVTTFAVVAGAIGGGFSSLVVIILGFANLLADGFSMAVSNYQGTKSERELVEKARRAEERQIDIYPKGEREEIRQVFEQKGFSGEVLENIVDVITQDKKLWVDTMLTEELGMSLNGASPLRSALATFGAFLVVGLIPLLPFVIPGLSPEQGFIASIIGAGIAFFGIGWAKGVVLNQSAFKSGFSTLLTGGAAVSLAYFVGVLLRHYFGMSE